MQASHLGGMPAHDRRPLMGARLCCCPALRDGTLEPHAGLTGEGGGQRQWAAGCQSLTQRGPIGERRHLQAAGRGCIELDP